MKLFTPSISWLVLATLWLVFFFSSWSKLWLIKVWELKQSAWADKKTQLITLHPLGEMASLLELNDNLKLRNNYSSLVVQAPRRNKLLPLANDASILRAVLYPLELKNNPGHETTVGIYKSGLKCQADICWEIP